MKNNKRRIELLSIFALIIISLIPLIPLLHPGLPVTHDGVDHVARIANFYTGLSEGNLIPRWGANLNWGYGHPVLMFLYPLSSYSASFLHFIGFDLENSVKLVFAIFYILSGVTMYFWAKEEFDKYVGVACAILYLFSPYRFIDMYVRGAIGEHAAFVFPPLILYFVLKFFSEKKNKKKKYFYFVGISVSSAFLILAHNAISIMFLPLIFLYIFYKSYKNSSRKMFVIASLAVLYGFLISSFFLMPAFMEGKYTLRDIVTGDEYKTRFVEPLKLLYGDWNFGITGQFSVQLGLVHLLGLILFPFTLLKLKTKKKFYLLLTLLLFFILSIFLMLKESQFLYEIFTTLKKFQFPWRFLSLSTFTLSVISATSFYLVKNEFHKKILLVVLIIGVLFTSREFIKAKDYFANGDSFYNKVYKSTTDTGESSPIWSIRFMEKESSKQFELIDGNAYFQKSFSNTTKHSYSISVESENARFVDNTVYFPGWKVFSANNEILVEFQDERYRGLITFVLPRGNHNVDVVFRETKLRYVANSLTIVSVIGILVIIPMFIFRKKHA